MAHLKKDSIIFRRLFFILIAILSSFFICGNIANAYSLSHRKIDQLLKEQPTASQGVVVINAKTGHIIYNQHGNYRLTPASNMKLFTAASALYSLGDNYIFNTTLSIQANIDHSVLNGNLYLRFSGDPTFKIADLKHLIAILNQKHIDTINGNVIIDGSRFSPPNYAVGWTHNSINWYYSAPITAVSINENKINLILSAAQKAGDRVKANIYPYGQYIKLNSHIRAATLENSREHCSLLINMNNKNQLSLGGCWPALRSSSHLSIAIKNPSYFVILMIKKLLADNNIKLKGKILIGKTPAHGVKIIAKHQSQPLIKIINTMLKESNNFYAGCLIKTIGEKYYHVGNFNNGILAEKRILSQYTHVNFSHLSIFDGSGQSYYDHLQARQIVNLLYGIYHSKIHRLFYNALAISGKKPGTLMYRMNNKQLLGRVHAKTGSMYAGNSSLSGYVYSKKGQLLIFSILMNNVLNMHKARLLQNQIINILYRYQ